MSRRHSRVVGAISAVGVFLAVGVAPLAHGDGEEGVIEAIAGAVAGAHDAVAGSAGAVDPGALAEFHPADVASLNPDGIASTAGSFASVGTTPDTSSNISIPLTVNPSISGTTLGGEPVISVAIGNGAAPVNVLVDTGSNGLVVPWYNTAWWNNLFTFPKGIGIGQFAGGVGYLYEVMPYTVEFGGNAALTTAPTDVDVVLFTFPTTLQSLFSLNWSLSGMLGPADAVGILGIGMNAVGPSNHNPIEDLPGVLGQGVLIDQANHTMTFGVDPLTGGVTVPGSPNAPLWVSFDGGASGASVNSIMDSGGVFGTIPATATNGTALVPSGSVGHALATGQTVTVYSGNPSAGGTELYTYTANAANGASPVVVPSGNSMNTGNWLFAQNQVYVSMAGNGSMHIVSNTPVNP